MSRFSNLDPCDKVECGTNAICKVVYATGKAFCSCPYLMIGDPYVKCGMTNTLYLVNLIIISNLSYFFNKQYFCFKISEGEEGSPTGNMI